LSAFADHQWLNEPPRFEVTGSVLLVETGERTDFWQDTYYGFRRDSGHFLGRPVEGDFTAEVRFDGGYSALYDQAGLMLRIDAETWVKAGVEYTDGIKHFSVVVTLGRSDWSVVALPEVDGPVTARLTRHDEAVRVQFLDGRSRWQMARLAPFRRGPAMIGPMCCSPERSGFRAWFEGFSVGPPIERSLHE
jgi:regulation of enolase protein 1 (concanavalin A-like superfamily)